MGSTTIIYKDKAIETSKTQHLKVYIPQYFCDYLLRLYRTELYYCNY